MIDREYIEAEIKWLEGPSATSGETQLAEKLRGLLAALEAAEAREAELRAQMQEIVLMAARKHRPAYDEQQRVIMGLRARVAELEQQVPCTKCSGNKVVSTTTKTFACLCLDPYSCALCKGTGYYEVTPIADCDQCKPLLAAPKEEV